MRFIGERHDSTGVSSHTGLDAFVHDGVSRLTGSAPCVNLGTRAVQAIQVLGPVAFLTQITGQGEGNGYYDWAGRRLFLIDGEPDPMCPGAYRYQHNLVCCDVEAPDSDPRSPRYEPMHLRHKPGDPWIIDTNRPEPMPRRSPPNIP